MWRVWKYFLKVVTGHSGQKEKTNPLRLWKKHFSGKNKSLCLRFTQCQHTPFAIRDSPAWIHTVFRIRNQVKLCNMSSEELAPINEQDFKDLKERMKLIVEADPKQYHNDFSLRRYLRAFKTTDDAFQVSHSQIKTNILLHIWISSKTEY